MSTAEKITYNACQGGGCHERCILKYISKDGKIIRVERADLKGPKADRYNICAKGIISGKLLDMPERLRYPLKRVGERGEGKFERISWDQALEEISEKLQGIIAKYGPESVIIDTFGCGIPLQMQGSLSCALAIRLSMVLGCANINNWPIDTSGFVTGIADFGDKLQIQWGNVLYWARHRPNYMLLWGGSPMGWTRPGRMTQMLLDNQEAGTKLVTVGLMYDSNAAKSDEFVCVKAGTDAALALAMSNILVTEGLYDSKFLIDHTVAPLLVREDNGLLLRRGDVEPDAVELASVDNEAAKGGEYVAWDGKAAAPVFIARASNEWNGAEPDILAEVEVAGIKCKAAFLKTKEHLAKWTPEAQEDITGIPATQVRYLVHDFMDHMPSGIFVYHGMRYRNGAISVRAVDLFAILSGCIGHKNGRLQIGSTNDGHGTYADFLIHMPNDGTPIKGYQDLEIHEIVESVKDPTKQQYKALINTYSNPLQNWPSRQMWTEQIFPSLDLIVVNEIRETDTALWADYVLPEASVLERYEISNASGDCLVLGEPIAPPLGESKDAAELYHFLAKCAGVGEWFDKTTEDWMRLKLASPDPGISGITPPVTWERLLEEKIVPLNVPEKIFDVWEDMQFKTLTGRIEFYNEAFVDVGQAIAEYVPTVVNDQEKRKKYPLQFYPGRSRFFMQAQFTEISELRELEGNVSTVRLNPRLAKERQICEGDMVELFNDQGAVQAVAHLSQAIPPDMAYLLYAYPSKDYLSDPPTVLTSPIGLGDSLNDFALACKELEMKIVNVPMGVTCQAMETFWDDLVDVRKV